MGRISIDAAEYHALKQKAAKYDIIAKNNAIAGKKSAAKLTPEQLTARAKHAVAARIKKYGQKSQKGLA